MCYLCLPVFCFFLFSSLYFEFLCFLLSALWRIKLVIRQQLPVPMGTREGGGGVVVLILCGIDLPVLRHVSPTDNRGT